MNIKNKVFRHWYETIIFFTVIITIITHLISKSLMGSILISLERALIEDVLVEFGIKIYPMTYNTVLVVKGENIITLKIVDSCSSLYPITAFIVSSIVLPRIRLYYRLQALLLFVPLIFVLNIFRIVATILIGLQFGIKGVHVFHDYIGTIIGIIGFGSMWVYWLNSALVDLFNRNVRSNMSVKTFLIILLLVTISPITLTTYAQSNNQANILVLTTDEADRYFLNHWRRSTEFNLVQATVDNITEQINKADVIVLLDPNYDEEQKPIIANITRIILEKANSGTPIVATINGYSMLKIITNYSDYEVECNQTTLIIPESYNAEKYCILSPPPYSNVVNGSRWFIIVEELSGSAKVFIPYNIVWAYHNTRDPIYIEIAENAVSIALESRAPYIRPEAFVSTVVISIGIAGLMYEFRRALRLNGKLTGKTSPFILPILGFKRIDREKAVQHAVRKYIIDLVREEGAITFNELWRRSGFSKATVSWHLSVLYREDIINIIKYRKYKFICIKGEETRIIDKLATTRRDEICILVRAITRNKGIEWAAKQLKTRPESIEDLYKIIENRIEEVINYCNIA